MDIIMLTGKHIFSIPTKMLTCQQQVRGRLLIGWLSIATTLFVFDLIKRSIPMHPDVLVFFLLPTIFFQLLLKNLNQSATFSRVQSHHTVNLLTSDHMHSTRQRIPPRVLSLSATKVDGYISNTGSCSCCKRHNLQADQYKRCDADDRRWEVGNGFVLTWGVYHLHKHHTAA